MFYTKIENAAEKYMNNETLYFYPYSKVSVEALESELTALLAENRAVIERVANDATAPTWESVVLPLDDAADRLHTFSTPIVQLK